MPEPQSLTNVASVTYSKRMQHNDETRYAGFWIRFLAEILDSLLLTVVAWLGQLLVVGIYTWVKRLSVGDFPDPFAGSTGAFYLQVINAAIYLVVSAIYYTIAHFRFGTTLGKRPFGIYVVCNQDLGWISWKQSVARTVGYAVSYIPFLIGYFMVAFHPEKRALHDLIAGTVSIRRSQPLPPRLEQPAVS